MASTARIALLALCLGTSLPDPPRAAAQVSVLTYHMDGGRTGQNTKETLLTPANVTPATFGKIFTLSVDGYVYAQPLYVPNVTIPGQSPKNVVYIATEHDSVYAFDADRAGPPLWQVSFINPAANVTPVSASDLECGDLVPEVGITGTPVIDGATGTLYVVARTNENGSYAQRLHALDIATGQEKLGGPVTIQASIPGTGTGSVDGMVPFDPLRQNQRAGLGLSKGIIYIAWASHCDVGPYHGWVMAYDAATLQQVAVYNPTRNGTRGGIWQSGGAPAFDAAGNIFLATGNGTFDADAGGPNLGDSVIKLTLGSGGLTVSDYFTPFNQKQLALLDLDLGAGGTILLPDQPGAHPHLAVQYGKQGTLYVVDRDNMGRFQPGNNNQIVQSLRGGTPMFSTAAFWNDLLFTLGSYDVLQSFSIVSGVFNPRPTARATTIIGFPGSTPWVSANGTTNGIVWVLDNSGYYASSPAVLYAYLATNVGVELYNSNQGTNGRDAAGPAVKFTVPVVVNGKAYVGGQYQVTVYGLL